MNWETLSLVAVVSLGSICVGATGCAKHGDPDPAKMLDDEVRAAFGVSLRGKTQRQCSQVLEKRFGLGSRKADVIRTLAEIAASRDDCELILSSEGIEGDIHYVPFVFHYERSPSEEIVWRETIDFGFDAQEKLAHVSGGSIMSIPRAEAPPWHPRKRP